MLSDFKYALYQRVQTMYVGTDILRTRRLKFQKQHPDFLDTMVWFFFFSGAGVMCGWNYSELLTVASLGLLGFKLLPLPLLQCMILKDGPAPFPAPNWSNPGGTLESKHHLHARRHFRAQHLKSETRCISSLNNVTRRCLIICFQKHLVSTQHISVMEMDSSLLQSVHKSNGVVLILSILFRQYGRVM